MPKTVADSRQQLCDGRQSTKAQGQEKKAQRQFTVQLQ